jgi:hypothetical protein
MQDDLARLSSRGMRVTATGTGHYIQNERADVVVNGTQYLEPRM